MEQGNYEYTFDHFREALRLEPNNYARPPGLKEAIRSKTSYTGRIQSTSLDQQNEPAGRWVFIIGIYIFYRILIEAAEKPALAPFLYPSSAYTSSLPFSSWIAMPVSNPSPAPSGQIRPG